MGLAQSVPSTPPTSFLKQSEIESGLSTPHYPAVPATRTSELCPVGGFCIGTFGQAGTFHVFPYPRRIVVHSRA